MKLSQETVEKLQSDTSCIRNICILAHVDHGKTSLSDSLLATNGIISQRMAGKVRYLDSREDEQLRGITMEASAISLYFKVMRRQKETGETETKEHLINLIDSPGHIDFSSEVSTSSRLCDGAVVLVDVVEGVCSQTVNVLRQCWVDKLKPILVLNKMDRLVTELQLSPQEAYQHLSKLIEQVNSVIGSFYAGDRMQDDLDWRESGTTSEFVEKDDEDLYFTPDKNNVIFASASDGWAFSVNSFAKIYSLKLGFSQQVLSKTLWGDFYLDMKNKKIIPGKKLKPTQGNLKPLFVSLILEQIWAVYDNCILNRNQEKLEKIVEKVGARLSARDLRSKDYKTVLGSIMSQWIPLSHALLGAVIEYLPSPVDAQQVRIDQLLHESVFSVQSGSAKSELLDPEFEQALRTCDSSSPENHTVAYVSKLISVAQEDLPKDILKGELTSEEIRERGRIAREKAKKASEAALTEADIKAQSDFIVMAPAKKDPLEWEFEDYEEEGKSEEDDEEAEEEEDVEEPNTEVLIAFTRIYSGSLTKGQKITVIGPKYDPSLPKDSEINLQQVTKQVEIKDLYLIMGREFVKMKTVPAGNIVGVVGLGDVVLKNATLCSEMPEDKPYINFASTSTLIHNKPIMKVAVEPTNPLRLARLERGLDLLARADPVLEWNIDDDSGELIMCVAGELHLERCLKDLEERFAKGCEVTVKEPVIPFREGLADSKITSKVELDEALAVPGIELEFDVAPLPKELVTFLTKSEQVISNLINSKVDSDGKFKESLVKILKECDDFTGGFKSVDELVDHIISFGPKRVGPNIFVEAKENNNQFKHLFAGNEDSFEYAVNVLNGFQLAMTQGPLANEPLQGVIVTLKRSSTEGVERTVTLSGRIITLTRQLIHNQFLTRTPRLFLAMYTCDIQATAEVLGKVYGVVQKRGGSIISEEMKEGTPFFTIEALIPVIEAFGFSEDIRKQTSGAASPQLVFAGFDMLDIDPFWVPNTEEELEELGEFAERENAARRYMNNIRRRKGLFVDEKVVKNAEKQRTLKKD